MKVATLGFAITSHSHFMTPKISSGTSIFMSCLTGTWQERRQPSFFSRRVKADSSVGSIEPPPSSTRHLHWAQEPPPPQADERKTPLAARVLSSLPPAWVVMVCSGSPLTSMVTSPVLTSLLRAARITRTRPTTTTVNMNTPSRMRDVPTMSVSYLLCNRLPAAHTPPERALELDAGEGHEAQRHQTHGNEGDAEPLQASRHIAVLEFLTDTRQSGDRKRPAHTGSYPVHHGFTEVVATLDHEQYTAHDRAVHGNQRQEHTQGVVKCRHELVEEHLHDLHDSCNHTDIGK